MVLLIYVSFRQNLESINCFVYVEDYQIWILLMYVSFCLNLDSIANFAYVRKALAQFGLHYLLTLRGPKWCFSLCT